MKQVSWRLIAIDHGGKERRSAWPDLSDATRHLTHPWNQSQSRRRNSDAGTTDAKGRCATRDVRAVSDTKARTRHQRRRQMAGISRRLSDNASKPAGAEGGGKTRFGEISSFATRQRQRKTTEWRRQLGACGLGPNSPARDRTSAICRRRR